jgi:HEAT repeat protein
MRKILFCLIAGTIAMNLLAGCIPSEPVEEYSIDPESVTKSPEELLEEWMAYAAAADMKTVPDDRPFAITDQLAATSPTALAPCIELLGDPESTPDTKVFVLQCITVNMTPNYIPTIKPLLNNENPDTRSCAYTLLGGIQDTSVPDMLKKGLEDDVPRVAFAALSGLAIHNVEPQRTEFTGKYWDDKTTLGQRLEILRVILKHPTTDDLDILADFLTEPQTSDKSRYLIAMVLGRIGTTKQIDALQKSLDMTADDGYKEIVESAQALIEERDGDTPKV